MVRPPTAGTSEGNGKKRKCDLDTNTLECPSCLGPFSIPVFQCRNGHSTCSACRKKLTKGCPACSQPVDIRNAAIEKVMESVQVPCKHSVHGCTTKLKYSERDEIEEHENKLCEYRPLQCPIQTPRRCLHIGPGVAIPSHLAEKHGIEVIESCLGSGGSTCFTMKATCPMTLLKTEKAWLIVNCWSGCHSFGSYVFCTVFGSSKVKVVHKLSLERVMLRGEEKIYLTYTCLQAVAPSHSDLDFESITLEDILVGPYINIPHEDQEVSELEFDLQVTVLS